MTSHHPVQLNDFLSGVPILIGTQSKDRVSAGGEVTHRRNGMLWQSVFSVFAGVLALQARSFGSGDFAQEIINIGGETIFAVVGGARFFPPEADPFDGLRTGPSSPLRASGEPQDVIKLVLE